MLCKKCGQREQHIHKGVTYQLCATCAMDNFFNFLELPPVEVRPTQRSADDCPVCFGDKYVLHNDGLMHSCPACKGTGKRR